MDLIKSGRCFHVEGKASRNLRKLKTCFLSHENSSKEPQAFEFPNNVHNLFTVVYLFTQEASICVLNIIVPATFKYKVGCTQAITSHEIKFPFLDVTIAASP